MKDNDLQRSRVRLTSGALSLFVLFGLLAAVLVGLFMVTETAVADLKATAVVSAWDYAKKPNPKYENSNVTIAANGFWVPFVHNLDFDTDPWVPATITETACPLSPTLSTQWAGKMYYGLGYTDTDGLAPGFRETNFWGLMSCDLNGDGSYLNNADLATFPNSLTAPPPYVNSTLSGPGLVSPTYFVPCLPGDPYCNLLTIDEVMSCTQNTCDTEIVTTFIINLDPNCDGTADLLPPSGSPFDVCFYAEAKTPFKGPGYVPWGGNLQARISTVGGDKTVNFKLEPTAIDLALFGAARQGGGNLVSWETANELNNLGFNLYRSASPAGKRAKVNGQLIASVAPGSATGATYSFLDESAAPGRSYWYWLEDLDLNGGSSQHGPAVVRGLPGRRRPMPAP